MDTRRASALDLFTDSVRIMGDATLCGVMEFDHLLDPVRLGEAAQACMLAHPVLHSRLVRGRGPAVWELVQPARIPPVTVEECGEDYHPHVAGPVDPCGPVQFRVRLLRRQSGDIVIINLAHAAADASGLHTLMSQLLQEYRSPGSIPPAFGGIPERDTLWTREFLGDTAPPAMKVINPLWPDPFGTSDATVSYHRACLSAPVVDAVRRGTKKIGGSLNDAVIAAYFLAMSDLTGHSGPVDVFFPVNLRQHIRDGSRVMSNQAANVSIPLSRRDGENMDEILPRVIKNTRLLKDSQIGIAEQAAMDAACDPAGTRIREMAEEIASLQRQGLADIFVSNPGPVRLPETAGLTDAYVCYPGGRMPTTCIITSSFCGRMTVTMGYQNSERAREGTRKALDLFLHHLMSVTGG